MHSTPNRWLVALTVMVPIFIEILDMTIVNVSLNHIQGSLSAGLDEVTWVLTSYLVSNAIVIPISGWLATRIGRKRYLLLSIGLFTLSSFACGSATSLAMLVVCRVLQGLGGGGLQPLSNSILLETFPPKEHGTAMAIFGMGIIFAPILGPILGGWITDSWSWRWIFYINVPVGILSIFLTSLFIVDPPYLRQRGRRIDVAGITLLVVGIGALQIVLDRGERLDWFASPFIVRFACISAVCLGYLIFHELRTGDPVIDLKVYRNRSFASGNIVMFLGFFGFFGSMVLLPIYVQKLMGYTSWWAGWVLAPGGISSLVMMPIVARLIPKVDMRKLLIVGLGIIGYSLYLMSRFNLNADFFAIMWPRLIQGIGLALFFVPLATLTLSRIPKERMGNASALFNFMRNIGGSFGVAVMSTELARRAQFHQARLSDHLILGDPQLQMAIRKLSAWLGMPAGVEALASLKTTLATIYGEHVRQAFMLAVNDAFFMESLFLLSSILVVFHISKSRPAGPSGEIHD